MTPFLRPCDPQDGETRSRGTLVIRTEAVDLLDPLQQTPRQHIVADMMDTMNSTKAANRSITSRAMQASCTIIKVQVI